VSVLVSVLRFEQVEVVIEAIRPPRLLVQRPEEVLLDRVEVRVDDTSRASGYVGSYRPRTTVLILRGDSAELNRFAVHQERVDVLAEPMAGGDLNHVLVRAAAERAGELFPELLKICRTTFARQAANLWKFKEHLHAFLQRQVNGDRLLTITDSFPIPVCRFARAPRCKRLPSEAA
jgi:RNase P/RNase MRP subunit p30